MTESTGPGTLRLKPAAEKARLLEDDIRRALAARGLQLVVSWPRSGTTATAHWQVNESAGRRVVDFWPASNRWRTPDGARSGVLDFLWEIVTVAAWVVEELWRETRSDSSTSPNGEVRR
jgi:hypothetical protein